MHISYATVWKPIDFGGNNQILCFYRFLSIYMDNFFPEHNKTVVRIQLISYLYRPTQLTI